MNVVAKTVHGLIFKITCFKLKCSYSFELLGNNCMTNLFRNMALSYFLVESSTVPVFSVHVLEI